MEWQAIVLLPFVDETRLRAALAEIQGPDNNDGSAAALSAPEPARAFLVQPSSEDSREQQCQDHDAATVAADAADASHAVTTWDFRPDGQLPQGRRSTGRSIAEAVAAAKAAAEAARAAARSEGPRNRASRHSRDSRGRGRSGRGRSGMAGAATSEVTDAGGEDRPRSGDVRADADDEHQSPVATQGEDANEENPLQSAQQGMAPVADTGHLEQQPRPGDMDSATRISATQSADAASSCAAA